MSTIFKPQDVRHHLRKFLNIVSTAGIQSRTKSSSWLGFTLKDLTESPIFVLNCVPVARNAALDYLGLLVLENAHVFLCQIENPQTEQSAVLDLLSFVKIKSLLANLLIPVLDIGEIDDAAEEISQTVHRLVRDNPDIWLSTIFQWSLDSLAEVSRRNYNRRPLLNSGLSESLRIYTSNKATKSLLDLLNYCIGELLRISPEKCVTALVDLSAKYEKFCDWILTYIGTLYPKTIINELLSCGLKDFHVYLEDSVSRQSQMNAAQITQRQEQYSRDKLASLAAIIGHLARQQSTQLKASFTELLEEALKFDAPIRNQYAIPLLLKLSSFSKDVAEIIVKDLGHLITVENLQTSYKIISRIPPQFLYNDNNISNSLTNIILSLGDTRQFVFVYEKLLYLAFGDISTSGESNEKWRTNISRNCQKILDVLLFNMDKFVHSQVAFSLDQLPVLQEIDKTWPNSLKNLFSDNEFESRHYFQLISLLCIVKGAGKTAEVLASILFIAQTSKQLSVFVSICELITPFQPNVSEELILKLKFYYTQLSTTSTLNILDNRSWLNNLKQILAWERDIMQKDGINFTNLIESTLNQYFPFMNDLIPLAYTEVADVVFDIFIFIGQPVHLLPGSVIRLIGLLVDLLYFCLNKIETNELDIYLALCDYVLQFINSQAQVTTEVLLKSLFSTLFTEDEWKKIFISFETNIFDNRDDALVESEMLGVKNRQLLTKNTAAALVHSGVIGKGAKRNVDIEIKETDLLKKLAFVRFVDKLCLNKSSSQTVSTSNYSSDTCRQMAMRLNEFLCLDAITLEHCWEDWESAKNYIPRYLVVFKQITENPVAWDLISIVAEAYPCLWYCLPLMKSVLGSIIAQFESAIDKNEKASAKLLKVLDRWFFVAKKGKMLSEPYTYCCEIVRHVSSYEAFVVLSQIWLYLQDISPDLKALEQHFESLHFHVGDTADMIIKGEPSKYLTPVKYVMQANIATVGYMFPRMFSVD